MAIMVETNIRSGKKTVIFRQREVYEMSDRELQFIADEMADMMRQEYWKSLIEAYNTLQQQSWYKRKQ